MSYVSSILKSYPFNSLPNNNILDLSKLKAFADDKIQLTKIMIFVFDRIENIVGKGENAGYPHFLLFPQCFQKARYSGLLNVGFVYKELYTKPDWLNSYAF